MALKIDIEMCSACGECVEACPSDALTLKNVDLTVDDDACSECGACESECQQGALRLV